MPRVLVLDDETTIRFVISEVLRDGGFETIHAASGREALDLVSQEDTIMDAMVMDLRLGDMTGKEVLKKVRQNPRWRDTPVVLMTGAIYDDEDFPQDAYQALYRKPFRIMELRKTLEDLLSPRGATPI